MLIIQQRKINTIKQFKKIFLYSKVNIKKEKVFELLWDNHDDDKADRKWNVVLSSDRCVKTEEHDADAERG